jgi:HSP20 family protein
MTVLRWQPWHDVETLRRQFDQLFEDFAPVSRDGVIPSVSRVLRTPAVELKTTATDVIVRAEVPGIAAADLDVEVTREAVAIAGEFRTEPPAEDHTVYRSELRTGQFRRVIPLPVPVQHDAVKANFKDGILTLTLPKVDATQAKAVKVNLTGEAPTAPTEP